jgi:hypothetical protein
MKSSGSIAPSAIFVAVVLAIETLLALALSVFLCYEILAGQPDSLGSAVGLLLMALMATAWIATTTVGFIRRKSFARGSALVWQVLQGAVGLASNQGLFARPDIGSGLLIPAVIVLALLLFSKPVQQHLGFKED